MKKDNLPTILAKSLPELGVEPDDIATIEYRGGFAKATVKKSDGRVFTQRVYSKGGYQTLSAFNPDSMNREELIGLVKDMKAADPKLTQTEIANELGISQSSVHNYLKKY